MLVYFVYSNQSFFFFFRANYIYCEIERSNRQEHKVKSLSSISQSIIFQLWFRIGVSAMDLLNTECFPLITKGEIWTGFQHHSSCDPFPWDRKKQMKKSLKNIIGKNIKYIPLKTQRFFFMIKKGSIEDYREKGIKCEPLENSTLKKKTWNHWS